MSEFEKQVAAELAPLIARYGQEYFGFDGEPTPSELALAAKLAPRVATAIDAATSAAFSFRSDTPRDPHWAALAALRDTAVGASPERLP